MAIKKHGANDLHGVAQFALFVTSYLPLFILIIARQISENSNYLHWSGFSVNAFEVFILKFGLSSVLTVVSILGFLGFRATLGNIQEVAKNGFPVNLKEVSNKNSESIGYIATYIIPFLFQSFNGIYECVSVLFLLIIIYRIYVNSSLLLINPILSIKYAIYEIEYDNNGMTRKGLAISKDKYLNDDAKVKLYEIGYKLYFATNNE
jgi:hypothetical protein